MLALPQGGEGMAHQHHTMGGQQAQLPGKLGITDQRGDPPTVGCGCSCPCPQVSRLEVGLEELDRRWSLPLVLELRAHLPPPGLSLPSPLWCAVLDPTPQAAAKRRSGAGVRLAIWKG